MLLHGLLFPSSPPLFARARPGAGMAGFGPEVLHWEVTRPVSRLAVSDGAARAAARAHLAGKDRLRGEAKMRRAMGIASGWKNSTA